MSYHDRIADLEKMVSAFDGSPVQLAHIINLAVRCNPRQPQGTVRKNIVAGACKSLPITVSMVKVPRDNGELLLGGLPWQVGRSLGSVG